MSRAMPSDGEIPAVSMLNAALIPAEDHYI